RRAAALRARRPRAAVAPARRPARRRGARRRAPGGVVVITVLTATLGRRPEMLAEAIASVRAQTFVDWEHVVVDDGSYSVPDLDGVRVVRVSHRGLGPARNAGLEVACGEAIALLDDDDVWYSHHLETVWEAMERTGADVVYADCDE